MNSEGTRFGLEQSATFLISRTTFITKSSHPFWKKIRKPDSLEVIKVVKIQTPIGTQDRKECKRSRNESRTMER